MTARMTINASGLVLGLLLWSAAGCTAVLGLEEAELDDTDQALVCALPDQHPAERCETTSDCEGCLVASCKGDEIQACVVDEACRKALFNHRVCVRDDCEDETGDCSECLGQASGAECLAACGKQCHGGEIVPLCDLFCACMDAKCPGQMAACLDDCRAGPTPDWELQCVISHCELADFDADHCLHATHAIRRCPTSKPATVSGCKASQGLVGYGCQQNGDCCSGLCSDHSCR